ncbi:putative hydroxypyruvate isomerase isoform X1 [Procambarus clarkii]|uniref:putative hydroxypyruvate isomerase isoform X1 n=1 Tax=Procambarus clarkii TaxID=6728 RepID=UPI001E6719FF|nr:putative hydroxypyruvate isomerase isoform X1 [Procambarus clarkii]XP_045592922.1 putative hydroxypyruvate isomerase isoform X1 [Procambarus clarkii]XP_045592924.1 putative hydroxypyruvate isomerase isoform X1 [Procambarus clarkii]XP_045592925.1 putative hydroxypyruvate isomerase isoform X1 [Procambarus clarkii]XP_045592926.1 putative hydroxypyruvate isomerase isoform X1 [Procambarus clarkii]
MKVAANLSFMFGEAGGLLARYKAAKETGFLAVECAFPYSVPEQEVAAVLKEQGLQQVLINSDPGDTHAGELGFAAIPGKEARFRDSLERSILYAKALGCSKLHIMSGRRCENHDESAHITTFEANLRHAVGRLAEENITGLIEPINPVSIPGYFLNNYDTAVSVIEKINSPNLRLQLDIFHLQMICGNVSNNIKKLAPLIGHVQIAQAPHRHEPSCPGELDYIFIFSKLREAGYSDYVGAEYTPSGSSSGSLQWMQQCGLTF